MNRKLLITGANGFIGNHLMRFLSNSYWEIIPFTRKKSSFKNEVIIDFCDPNFNTVIKSLPKVDTILHLGARISWDEISRDTLFEPNVLATAELANWAYKNGVYFIFASTAIVCGVRNPYISYESNPNPDTDYGYSKWLAEEIIKMSGVRHAILRFAGVFGRGGPYHLGINKAIDDALKGIVPTQVSSGNIRRNYIYVGDLCNIIKLCSEKQVEGTHLVAGSMTNTISEMLKIICDILLPGKKPVYRDGKDGQDQIIEHSSWLPKTRSFREAIEDIGRNTDATSV